MQLPTSESNTAMKREKKRTLSLPTNPDDIVEKEDELLSTMQALIQEAQNALQSPIRYK